MQVCAQETCFSYQLNGSVQLLWANDLTAPTPTQKNGEKIK
uniref:Uncharacterized protein n=1 Tax=Anguilla anguilla TaxID=7936 RepID=A0A0E9XAP9_ANGAN